MGYDEPECMICFVNGGSNNPTTRKDICLKCFDELIFNRSRIYKVSEYLTSLHSGMCDKCLSKEVMCYEIYCHSSHIGWSESSSSDND